MTGVMNPERGDSGARRLDHGISFFSLRHFYNPLEMFLFSICLVERQRIPKRKEFTPQKIALAAV